MQSLHSHFKYILVVRTHYLALSQACVEVHLLKPSPHNLRGSTNSPFLGEKQITIQNHSRKIALGSVFKLLGINKLGACD